MGTNDVDIGPTQSCPAPLMCSSPFYKMAELDLGHVVLCQGLSTPALCASHSAPGFP
jgi:hypothetical protein